MASHDANRITLATLPSGTPLETTVHTYTGDSNGPTVYIQAAQHGQEVNGTEVLRRLHHRLDLEGLAGQIVAVPIANPLTFDTVSYTAPERFDSVHPNMNRVWPGDDNGSLHERMAATLWEFAVKADAIFDLHTGSAETLSHVVASDAVPEAIEMAKVYGTDLLLREEAHENANEEWHTRNFEGKLRVAAAHENIPTITPEIGFNKWILYEAVETAVTGIQNVLRHLGMLNCPVEPNGTPVMARNHLGRVRATDSGKFIPDPSRQCGDTVTEGDYVGSLYHPTTYDVIQTVEADRNGILYQIQREATVVAGDMLLSVAFGIE